MATRMSAFLFLLLIAPAAFAAGKPERPADALSPKSFTYRDGDRTRTVWMSDRFVAEFGTDASDVPPGTKPSRSFGAVRLWEVESGNDAASVLVSARATTPARRFSAVFQDNPQGTRIRALPGGVIAHLDAGIDTEEKARRWAERNGVTVLRKHPVGRTIWELEGEAGIASLELANRLTSVPGVVSASPVWWTELSTK